MWDSKEREKYHFKKKGYKLNTEKYSRWLEKIQTNSHITKY